MFSLVFMLSATSSSSMEISPNCGQSHPVQQVRGGQQMQAYIRIPHALGEGGRERRVRAREGAPRSQ